MSLYNMVFGVNDLAPLVLDALGTSVEAIPRFRDAFYDAEKDRLIIYTRTGGGNRDYYESEERCRSSYPDYFRDTDEPPSGPWNEDLRRLPGFIEDEDDDFDSTYAMWFYSIPTAFVPLFHALRDIGRGKDEKPAERWERVIADLKDHTVTEETKRALKAGEQIMAQINKALNK